MRQPVGRIDFYGSDGKIGESVIHYRAEGLVAQVVNENYYGCAMHIALFENEKGETIDRTFLLDLDPPNVTVSVEKFNESENEKNKEERKSIMNEWERARRMAEYYKQKYPKGTRIELIQMGDDPRPVPPGMRGTVAYVDDMGQIGMHWDNGQSLSLIPGEDSFRVLNQEEIASEKNAASFETVGPTLT